MQIAERSSPTLLNLPTELRNTIFSYVYGKAVADHIILLRFKSGRAGVELDKAPPNKDSLLICRQFYNEMKGLQAVAYRRYWAVQKFLIIADRDTKKDLHLATIADLRHICNLAVTMTSCRPQPTIPGGDSPWYMIESLRSIGFLKRLETMMGSLLRKDDGTRCDPRAAEALVSMRCTNFHPLYVDTARRLDVVTAVSFSRLSSKEFGSSESYLSR
jgi:hypothetical protein